MPTGGDKSEGEGGGEGWADVAGADEHIFKKLFNRSSSTRGVLTRAVKLLETDQRIVEQYLNEMNRKYADRFDDLLRIVGDGKTPLAITFAALYNATATLGEKVLQGGGGGDFCSLRTRRRLLLPWPKMRSLGRWMLASTSRFSSSTSRLLCCFPLASLPVLLFLVQHPSFCVFDVGD
jgi:hypothetical protein